MRWTPTRIVVALVIVAALTLPTLGSDPDAPATGPNIVLIMTDDMRADDLPYMPHVERLLADRGVTFRQMLSPYPLCCPARAELLSGQYSHNNGVQSNVWPRGGYYKLDNSNTLPVWLHNAGYETAFMGKYLNEYGSRDPQAIPPGWDYWDGSIAGIYNYHGVITNSFGTPTRHRGSYQTSLFDGESRSALDTLANGDRPFFMWVSYIAPHLECATESAVEGGSNCWHAPPPAPRDGGTFSSVQLPHNSSINEPNMQDKGRFMQTLPRISAKRLQFLRQLRIQRIESLQAVDRAVAHLVTELKQKHEYRNTYLVFTSDNGVQLGEHRWQSKLLGYEPSVRVPLIIAGPGLPAGVVRRQEVTMVDLGATLAEMAGAKPGRLLDGQPLLPLAKGTVPDGRDRVVPLEAAPHDVPQVGWLYRGVRTNRYTLLVWRNGDVELYDRKRDPYEVHSVAGQPAYARVQADLERQLQRLRSCAGADCMSWYSPPTG